MNIIPDMFSELAVLLLLAAGIGALGVRLRQPLIVSFIAVGILVGPSVLGWVSANDKIDLLAKLGIGKKVTASLKDVRKGGRVIVFNVDNKENTARVSSRDTKVMIAGKKAKRSALKAGMNCEVNYPANGGTAMSILCK